MELYLLRHGLSLANTAKLVTGSKRDPLCAEGRKQAREASRLLHHFGLDGDEVVRFVSDWERARETAALAAPALHFTTDARLGETDAGIVAEMPLEEFNQTNPAFWTAFSPDRAYPDGESHAQLFARVLAWQKELESTLPAEARVLAVTHAGPVCCLLHAACKVDLTNFPTFLAAHASLTKLEKIEGGPWRLVFFSLSSEMMA